MPINPNNRPIYFPSLKVCCAALGKSDTTILKYIKLQTVIIFNGNSYIITRIY